MTYTPTQPKEIHHLIKKSYALSEAVPYINWIYFYYAWGLTGQKGQTPEGKAQKAQLKEEAIEMVNQLAVHYRTHVHILFCETSIDGEDLFFPAYNKRIPLLRQQTDHGNNRFLSLSDFIDTTQVLSQSTTATDYVGLFAATIDKAAESQFKDDPYHRMMAQTVCDRLVEASIEMAHEEVRKTDWGYAPEEDLPISELLINGFQGIRPAVGYPSLPDQSINFLLKDLLDFDHLGITLTETGAMQPHASVSGLMIAHPEASYFNIDRIGEDQFEDYARRRQIAPHALRPFLGGVLG